ncbi:MAG: thiamine ABC transporter ATP-binding protein, partial [Rhodobacteraceae bacterium]|nr:thiamine ABC transporter ATP-binding protein [Paracoccaceae bacterium]
MLHLDDVAIRQAGFTLTADLRLTAGVTSVIGPSGGGKSTLLGAIGGF